MIYIRSCYVTDETLFMKCSDTHIWVKLKGSLFSFDKDLYVCLCYIIPSNSSRVTLSEFNTYDVILENIVNIQNITNENCYFMLIGDLNSRVGQENDFVSNDYTIHMNLLPDDYTSDVEIPRKTQDNIINANGYLLLDFLKQSGLRIANGRVCEDKDTGAVTFVGSRGTSLVDYCIVNPDIFSHFNSFYVHDPNIISDHCLIEFSIDSK